MRVFKNVGLVEQLGSDIIANGDNNGDIKTVLEFIKNSPEITAKRISLESGLSERKISRIIRILRENSIITSVVNPRNGYCKITIFKKYLQFYLKEFAV